MSYSKSLFTIEFIKSLSEADIILNIDESIISWSTKWEYSILKNGGNGRILNDMFSNSVNVILVASNSGWTFTGLWHTTTTRHIFINFLKSLKESIQIKLKISTQRMIMILDDTLVHQCKESRAYMRNRDGKWFLFELLTWARSYIEMMSGSLKGRLVKIEQTERIDLRSEKGTRTNLKAIKMIRNEEVRVYWRILIKELKLYLIEWFLL